MKTYNLFDYLKNLSYPGRGIAIGTSEDGNYGVIAYFIMGRSENSRNRIFVPEEDGIRTQAFDPSKITDPSLIIYAPVRVLSHTTIVTNGDQTDTIYEVMAKGGTFEEALRTRIFEPDAPNYTPRISGILSQNGETSSYKLSLLKSANGNPDTCQRFYFEYENKIPGLGHIVHTYQDNQNPLPSFEGEPRPVTIEGNIDTFTQKLWDSLNEDNKVSLFVRYINLKDNSQETKIINKNK
ncbi:MAG: IMP cyclohydrolase [Anaerovoracaceae bacterium]|jgi:IMP cyclohydrolase